MHSVHICIIPANVNCMAQYYKYDSVVELYRMRL